MPPDDVIGGDLHLHQMQFRQRALQANGPNPHGIGRRPEFLNCGGERAHHVFLKLARMPAAGVLSTVFPDFEKIFLSVSSAWCRQTEGKGEKKT